MWELIEGKSSVYLAEGDAGSSAALSKSTSSESARAGEATNEPSEEDLVAAAKNGDTEAFGELIQRHRKTCLKRAMMMIRNRSDAEDEVQNAFWKAFQR